MLWLFAPCPFYLELRQTYNSGEFSIGIDFGALLCGGEELEWLTTFYHFSSKNHHCKVCVNHCLHSVRYHDNRALFEVLPNHPLHQLIRLHVDIRCWLIQQQNLVLRKQGSGETEELLLSCWEVALCLGVKLLRKRLDVFLETYLLESVPEILVVLD